MRLICGGWVSQALYVAARLGIADQLAAGPRPVEELAKTSGANPDALHRLLRLLASYGVFEEKGPGVFGQTALGECLEREAFGSVRAMALLFGEEHYRAWGGLLHSVETGRPAFDRLFGSDVWSFLAKNPEAGATFDAAMSSLAALGHGAVISA
jgi:hypothetical protein